MAEPRQHVQGRLRQVLGQPPPVAQGRVGVALAVPEGHPGSGRRRRRRATGGTPGRRPTGSRPGRAAPRGRRSRGRPPSGPRAAAGPRRADGPSIAGRGRHRRGRRRHRRPVGEEVGTHRSRGCPRPARRRARRTTAARPRRGRLGSRADPSGAPRPGWPPARRCRPGRGGGPRRPARTCRPPTCRAARSGPARRSSASSTTSSATRWYDGAAGVEAPYPGRFAAIRRTPSAAPRRTRSRQHAGCPGSRGRRPPAGRAGLRPRTRPGCGRRAARRAACGGQVVVGGGATGFAGACPDSVRQSWAPSAPASRRRTTPRTR